MAPTNPTEGLRGGSRQGGYGRSSNNRRRDNLSDRSVFTRDHNTTEEYVGSREASNSKCQADENHPIKSHKDKGGGRSSGTRRKEHSNKNNQTTSNASKRDRLYSEVSDEHCPVCLNRMKIYAVGMCNHPVCSECSTRMRILCAQNECPICRQDMPKVIHTMSRQKFEDIQHNIYIMDRKYKICFEDESVQSSYKVLLRQECPICKPKSLNNDGNRKNDDKNTDYPSVFSTFKQLETHVRRDHELFYCDLCAENIKIFSHERKLYSRSELATHRRKGDENDSSHKGHPLCEFCQARWVDSDELFRHLRRDHFFCHFCDADGKQVYYESYDDGLREHFKYEHYLCEEENCVNEQFTSAFRDEIDLKAHISERHSGHLSKAAAKQIRTVDVDFTYTRPGTNSQVGRRRGRDFEESIPSHGVGVSVVSNQMNTLIDQIDGPVSSTTSKNAAPVMTTENFPSLGGRKAFGASTANNSQGNLAQRVAISSGRTVKSEKSNNGGSARGRWAGTSNLTASGMLDEEFPSLTGNSVPNLRSSEQSINYANLKKKGQKQNTPQPRKSPEEQFPSLGAAASSLTNFRISQNTPTYRNISGHEPAWNSTKKSSNDDNITEQPAPIPNKDSSSGMITFKKKIGKSPAPMPQGIEDFPVLEKSAKENGSENKSDHAAATVPKKKKNKNKKGMIVGEDMVSVRSSMSGTTLKGASNLTSAADLISLDSSKKLDLPSAKNNRNELIEKAPKKNQQNLIGIDDSKAKKPNKETNGSELKITSASSEIRDEFPTLGTTSSKISAHFVRNESTATSSQVAWNAGAAVPVLKSHNKNIVSEVSKNVTSLPPPGFDLTKAKQTAEATSVPPGFQGNSKISQNNEHNPKHISTKSSQGLYIPPKSFTSRNSDLLILITKLMGGAQSTRFSTFKSLSTQFRSGAISCADYHKQCLELVDLKSFELFFPELLCLLPDINKQGELYSIHISKFPKNTLSILPCPTCCQIVTQKEKREHMKEHLMDDDFPQLS